MAGGYWVLKATDGLDGTCYWKHFLRDDVVAIGWHELSVDPMMATFDEFLPDYKRSCWRPGPADTLRDERDAEKAAHQAYGLIRKFVKDMDLGDKVIVCRGYPPNQKAPVRLWGLATIEGDFFIDTESDWWKFQRKASLQEIDQDIPKHIFTEALHRQSLRLTIHKINEQEYNSFYDALRKNGWL